jgi:hypothetical protein
MHSCEATALAPRQELLGEDAPAHHKEHGAEMQLREGLHKKEKLAVQVSEVGGNWISSELGRQGLRA